MTVQLYLRAWIDAPIPAAAPRNDLALLKALKNNKSDDTGGKAALGKFSSHLCSEELVALTFFDSEVPFATKGMMPSSIIPPWKTPQRESSSCDLFLNSIWRISSLWAR